MAEPTLNERLQKFEETYGITVSIDEINAEASRIRYRDQFLFGGSTPYPEAARYRTGLRLMLGKYIDSKTMIKAGKIDTSLSRLDMVDFVRQYEGIMKQHYIESGEERERPEHEGFKVEDLLRYTQRCTQKYNKPLSDVWADHIISGKIKYEDMKTLIDSENSNALADPTAHDTYTNVLLAKQAMEKVCKERGFFWKVFNLFQFLEERSYLKTLTERVDILKRNDRTVDEDVEDFITESVMSEAYDTVNDYEPEVQATTEISAPENNAPEVEENQELDPQAELEDIRDLLDLENFSKIANNDELSRKFAEELFSDLPLAGNNVDMESLYMPIRYSFPSTLRTIGDNLEDAVDSGASDKEQMKTVTKEIFKFASERCLGFLALENENDKMVVAQVITDRIMKKLPIVNKMPEKFGEFAKGYVINNYSEFGLESQYENVQDHESIFEEMKQLYNAVNQNEKRQGIVVDIEDQNADKELSARVNEAPSIKAPDLNKN